MSPATSPAPARGTARPVRATRRPSRPAWIAAVAVLALAATAAVLLLGNSAASPEQALAAAINLHTTDLPGFTVEAAHHSSTDAQFDSRWRSCVGSPGAAQSGGTLAGARSPAFTSGSGLAAEQVVSGVTIKRSADLVRADLTRASIGRLGQCMTRALDGGTIPTSSGVVLTIGNVHVERVAAHGRGTNGGFGIRLTMTMSALGRSVPVVIDLWGYAVGRDELALMTTAIEHPFSSASERQLTSLLIERALARPH